MRLNEIDTPALLLDLDAMERNLAKMAGFFSAGSTKLRPHYKNHKCPALALACQVVEEGLWLRGLMGYEGHVAHLLEGPEKESAYDLAMNALMQTRCLLEQNGIPIEIVSTGGTGTHHLTRRFTGITEF